MSQNRKWTYRITTGHGINCTIFPFYFSWAPPLYVLLCVCLCVRFSVYQIIKWVCSYVGAFISVSVPTRNLVCMFVCLCNHFVRPNHKSISDNSPARHRRNHCTVEEGVHIVPTLRNRVVIFPLLL